MEQGSKGTKVVAIFWMPLDRKAEPTRWSLHGFNDGRNALFFYGIANGNEAFS